MHATFAIARFRAILPAFVLLTPFLAVRADEDEGRASGRSTSSEWTDEEWTQSTEYENIQGYADRPNDRTLKAIAVEWDKPEIDGLGNLCILRGRLLRPADAKNEMRPVNWFQGVTVYMGMTPGARPDWSQGMNQGDTAGTTSVLTSSGKFQLRIDLRETRRERHLEQSFQFGIALAKHTSTGQAAQTVEWSSRAPAIPATVQMLAVPAAAELTRALELVNRASRWPSAKSNGVELIRAVNALQPLGKNQALATLERFVQLTREFDYHDDQEIVFWIIRLLFEPIRLDDRIPFPAIAIALGDGNAVDTSNWPLSPITVLQGIPFMVGHPIGMGGMPEQPSSHIEWARRHGIVRDEPLVPTTNPFDAAEGILTSPQFKALDEFSRKQATRAIRLQAAAMVKGLLRPEPAHDGAADNDEDESEDEHWTARLQAAAGLKIRWDPVREEFVSDKK